MKARIFNAYKNQFCQECGQKSPSLIEVSPNLVESSMRICMKCYRTNFKKDVEVS